MASPMNFQESVDYIYSFVDFERTGQITYNTRALDLKAFSELLVLLSNPHEEFAVVHVAGTKGKGSTCAMLASVLRASGLRVGLFTSPHLLDVRERIQVNGKWIAKDSFARALSVIKPVHAHLGLTSRSYRTTFELLTAAALLHFAEEHVEVAVLETGLGGRLDATNVVHPALSVITRIGYDHTGILGGTLSAIAAEKAGIIKENIPVVVADQKPEALTVIKRVAAEKNCPVVEAAREFRATPSGTAPTQTVSFKGNGLKLEGIRLPLLGAHQIQNASCVVAAAKLLSSKFPSIDAASIGRGLAEVRLMGRVELLRADPFIVVDCAHNLESAESLVETLQELCVSGKKIAIIGISTNKDARAILAIMTRYFDKFLVTRADTKRAMSPVLLADQLRGLGAQIEAFDSASDAANAGLSMIGPEDLLCVTGSVYLAGQLRPFLVESAGRFG
ncbi:MAG: bifunctional folylpolyglutamate synthase/dihydrofolate synthase [Candidatus Coatesbacteria bacterium]|nr:MAG: bifunctional folylpolyglutamate synthase/dihydrofolate synthase [Candidatus Coatesbacteria bacterium]